MQENIQIIRKESPSVLRETWMFWLWCWFSCYCIWLASPWTVACQAPLSMGFPGKNTGVDCHSLLQGSSRPRNWTHVSFTAGEFSTAETPQETLWKCYGDVIWHGCESWTIKKAAHQRIDAFELWCWRRLLRVPWTARRSNQSILKEISPEYSLKGLMSKLKAQHSGYVMWRVDSLE